MAADVRDGKVSAEGAREHYGVILHGPADDPSIDEEGTGRLRDELRARIPADAPFFDRGPGFPSLSGGLPYAEVDHL